MDAWNFALSIAGNVFTLVGFGIAITQLKKTRSAAESAQAASVLGTTRIRYNQLIILVPQLQALETEMDAAVRSDESIATERLLVRWRQIATQAMGILRDEKKSYQHLVDAVEKACNTAITAKGRIAEITSDKTLATVVAGARKELSAVNDQLGALLGALATQVGTTDEDEKA